MDTEKPLKLPRLRAEDYDFYQLIESIYRRSNIDLDKLLSLKPQQDPIRFQGENSLGFAIRDVAEILSHERYYQITLPFSNLIGAHSPLPNYYLDTLIWEELLGEPKLLNLLNLFNHRLISLLFKIWRKYRYYICFTTNGEDTYSQRMFSLVGLGSKEIRKALPINQSKMLAYAGILASSSRSPKILSTLIAHCFELSDVQIQSWQFRWVNIPDLQKNQIGHKNAILGKNFIIGSRIPDYTGKFKLKINKLDKKTFLKFLPNGSLYQPLITFVSFILRDQLAWDLELTLAENEISGMKLTQNKDYYLGWTTFLGKPPMNPNVLITIQE